MGLVVWYTIIMATKVYDTQSIKLMDGTNVELGPLKIRYLRKFMDRFEKVLRSQNDFESMEHLAECARIAMEQYYPKIAGTIEELEDNLDLPTIYKIIEITGGVKISADSDEPIKDQASSPDNKGSSWQEMDLAKLEAEVFLLGIWKNYDELELNMSMPEIVTTLSSVRELDYSEKKFLAAIQGVDLDAEQNKDKGQKEWEDMKARVFSKGATNDSNDVLALQGVNAQKAGFGIGMGLDYEDGRDPALML